jgi:hypothetical protein
VSWLAHTGARYSEFYDLREKLVAAFPHSKSALPMLPPKSFIRMGESSPKLVSKLTAVFPNRQISTKIPREATFRTELLSDVRSWTCLIAREKLMECSCVMLNPEFAGSAIVKEFIFA